MLLRLHLQPQFYLTWPPKSQIVCSDTTDKDKSTTYFFINCLYEEAFKDVQIQNVDDIIYIDGPSSEAK